jgi:hypothetical protein
MLYIQGTGSEIHTLPIPHAMETSDKYMAAIKVSSESCVFVVLSLHNPHRAQLVLSQILHYYNLLSRLPYDSFTYATSVSIEKSMIHSWRICIVEHRVRDVMRFVLPSHSALVLSYTCR